MSLLVLVAGVASCQALLDFGSAAVGTDGGAAGVDAGGNPCGPGEKRCGEQCVTPADPAFGCTRRGCSPCHGFELATFACGADACVLTGCKDGYKRCGTSCVSKSDPGYGCASEACEPCPSTVGTATCTDGTCNVACATGTTRCGNVCVDVDDPTYGCGTCNAVACPPKGTSPLLCVGGECQAGSCPSTTKLCNGKCVPLDVNNGCADPNRCTPCAAGEQCRGNPSRCQCVPEPLSTTCATKVCGPATNNCKQSVTCPDKCSEGTTCGSGTTGSTCVCVSDANEICANTYCNTDIVDSCGVIVRCNAGEHNCLNG